MATERDGRQGIGGRLVEGLEARLALFGFELGEERDRVLATLVFALVAVVLLFVGLLSLNVFVVLLFWEQRIPVAGGITALYLVVGISLALAARGRLRDAPQPFEATLGELRRDAEAFRQSGGSDG
jgi:uncharacterized membrane protein YqjE